MSLLAFDRVIQTIAEDKLRAAIAKGEFDCLPGLGQPLPLLDEPYDPNWWIRRKLQREELRSLFGDADPFST